MVRRTQTLKDLEENILCRRNNQCQVPESRKSSACLGNRKVGASVLSRVSDGDITEIRSKKQTWARSYSALQVTVKD